MNPIIRRELLGVLRTPGALAAQAALAAGCALLVLLRWPADGVSDLSGARSVQVLQVFGYGMLAGVLFLVPAFPATSIVRERVSGTLALLLNTPMSARSIYLGKLGGVLGFAAVLLAATAPAAGACHALGGVSSGGGVLLLYGVIAVAAVQFSTLGLLVSSLAASTAAALRTTYALVLAVAVLPLAPYWLLQGGGPEADLAEVVRNCSPIPAVMEVLGHTGVGTRGMALGPGAVSWYLILALATSVICALATLRRLSRTPLDRSRAAGVMTEDRSARGRAARRLLFLFDPQRRSGNMPLLVNPVLVKELRNGRLGRSHWAMRLVALCAILSLGLSYVAMSGAMAWGAEEVGGALVLLQAALLILFVPSLASGLISAEREGGTWQLLRTTPLSAGAILRGKLLAAAWPVVLLMCGTLPGYLVLAWLDPEQLARAQRVVACLGATAGFALVASAAAGSLFRSTARATAAAYVLVVGATLGPLLVWLGRDAPFGHSAVEAALAVSPVAAALHASGTRGFAGYDLLPLNWWITGVACVLLLVALTLRTRQLYRPE